MFHAGRMRFPRASELKRIRKSLDITQVSLARESGVSQSTIAKIEGGRISASYETVVQLFETLDRIGSGRKSEVMAGDVASRNVVTVQSSDPVQTAIEIMRTAGFSQLPVLRDETPVGSISERSIFNILRSGGTLDEIKDTEVSAVMDDSFPVVNENTSMSAVTSMMSDCNAVLVARRGRIVGVITGTDMLRLI